LLGLGEKCCLASFAHLNERLQKFRPVLLSPPPMLPGSASSVQSLLLICAQTIRGTVPVFRRTYA